jgi:hypothetical protein
MWEPVLPHAVLEEQEAKLLEKFFTLDELEAAKEEKEENVNDVEVTMISDIEEQEDNTSEEIDLNTASIDAGEDDDESELPLPEISTQIRPPLGRKRKVREDNAFEYH